MAVDMDVHIHIHRKSVDMDMDMDVKFHIHGNPVNTAPAGIVAGGRYEGRSANVSLE